MAGKAIYRNQLSDQEVAERDAMRSQYDAWDEFGMKQVFTVGDVWCEIPEVQPETRAERIARHEQMGFLDPDCDGCKEFYRHPTLTPFAPHHKPSESCGSGKRPHCTCPRCWG